MPRIDKLLLFRSVQVVRRLQLKNREIGLFCNIAASTLNDKELFPEILTFMDANRALASSLMLEMRQNTLRAMGPLETESLGISLIAERIEGEAQVVDLLEYDVRFGQGFLFSQPRPVRAEALRGPAETEQHHDEPDMTPKAAVGGSGGSF